MTRKRKRTEKKPAAPIERAPAKSASGWAGALGCTAVAACAFVLGFHKIDDFDTWWHLAAGRWIVAHGSVPSIDTLSHTVRDHPWINLQWGFDVVLYGLQSAGGPALLCWTGALTFMATAVLTLRVAALRAGAGIAAVLALLVVLTAQERVTLRPELLSFLFLAGVLFVLDRAKYSDERWAFALIPLMMLWANVHALFVIGVFAIACSVVGTLTVPTRRFAVAAGSAVLATLINPFGVTGVTFPFKLLSRIDRSTDVFQTIGEFSSPFAADATGVSIVSYKVLLAFSVLAAVMALLVSLRPNRSRPVPAFDWGGLIFFAGLAMLSATARRNAAIFAVGIAPFVASCLGRLVAAFTTSRVFAKTWQYAALGAGIAAVFVSATVATGAFYRFDNSPQEFGTGVIEGTFPIRAAAFARAAALPPTLYNDMAAGGYLAWDNPVGTGVFVDGRLEVYDTEFLTEYAAARPNSAQWEAAANRYSVQTVIIFHRFEPDRALVGRLVQEKLWSLVYVDEVAAVLVRTRGNEAALARAAAIRGEWDQRTQAWLERPVDRTPYPAGRIEGARAYARILATVGRAEPAIAAYLKLLELGVPTSEEVDRRLMLARYFASKGQLPQAEDQARRILQIDPNNDAARAFVK